MINFEVISWNGLMTIITAASVIIAFLSLYRSNKQFKTQTEPTISMILSNDVDFLYLTLTNTGKRPAKEISIEILKIINQTENIYEKRYDRFQNKSFDLYPSESVSSRICLAIHCIGHEIDPIVNVKIKYNDNESTIIRHN